MKRKSKVACQQLEKLPSSRDPRTEKLVRADQGFFYREPTRSADPAVRESLPSSSSRDRKFSFTIKMGNPTGYSKL